MIIKIYFILNFIIYSALSLTIINAYIITPFYLKSKSEILNAAYLDIEQPKKTLNDLNHKNITLFVNNTNIYFKNIEQQSFKFRRDFFNMQFKNNKELNQDEIQKLIDNNFNSSNTYQRDMLKLIRKFENNNKIIKENYVSNLSDSFYNTYPSHKYLVIDKYIEKTLANEVLLQSYISYDEQLIGKKFDYFKNTSIFKVIDKYNHIRKSNILDYTLIGMAFSIGRSVSNDNALDKDLSNSLSTLKNNLLYDTNGIVKSMKQIQVTVTNKT